MKPRVGISACLLGQRVRYDGDHRRRDDLLQALRAEGEWVPVCPEVEAGFEVPRETLDLVQYPGASELRLVTTYTRRDHTCRMLEWANARQRCPTERSSCSGAVAPDSSRFWTWTNSIRRRAFIRALASSPGTT